MPAWSFLFPFLSIPCSAFCLPHPPRALLSRRSPLPSVFPHACQLYTHTLTHMHTHQRVFKCTKRHLSVTLSAFYLSSSSHSLIPRPHKTPGWRSSHSSICPDSFVATRDTAAQTHADTCPLTSRGYIPEVGSLV